MNQIIKSLTILSLSIFSISCAVVDMNEAELPQAENKKVTQCEDPRPQMCTREYNPVCATKDTGVRCVTTPCLSTEEVTYPTGCTACADPDVISYTQGACEQ